MFLWLLRPNQLLNNANLRCICTASMHEHFLKTINPNQPKAYSFLYHQMEVLLIIALNLIQRQYTFTIKYQSLSWGSCFRIIDIKVSSGIYHIWARCEWHQFRFKKWNTIKPSDTTQTRKWIGPISEQIHISLTDFPNIGSGGDLFHWKNFLVRKTLDFLLENRCIIQVFLTRNYRCDLLHLQDLFRFLDNIFYFYIIH